MGDITFGLTFAAVLTREVFSNQTALSKGLFYALSLLAIAIFVWGCLRRVRLWRLGRAGARPLNIASAGKHLVMDVLLQRRVLGRGWASVGHVLLFGGFMGLFLATTLLGIEHGLAILLGRAADDPVFHKGVYFVVYEMLADGFGIAMLVGCGIFAVRRWRRGALMDHRWTDWWALGALAFLGVTGYAVEGLRIIEEHTPLAGFSFVGLSFARVFEACGLREAGATTVHYWMWWLHAVVALVFVAAFPYARLLHAIAGTLRLALAPSPLGVMTKLDVEEVEATGVIGVSAIQQFERRQLLELDACMACGRCEAACPAFEAGKPLSPRAVVQDLCHHLDAVGPGLLANSAGGLAAAKDAVPELAGGVISEATLWSCTTCSACVDVCPVGVNPLGFITDMRRHLIGEGRFRGAPATALQKMDRAGNPWGLPAQDRMAWAAGLPVPLATGESDFDVLYWVGCAASYDRRIQKVARSVAQLLLAADVRFAVLGPEERCTGESARRMGDEFLFQQLAATNMETLERRGVKRGAKTIVSHCPHCVNSFKQDYSQLGGDYEVLHHTEFLAKLVEEKRLPPATGSDDVEGGITYHDPCYLARVGGVTEPPRQLVQIALGPDATQPLTELPRNREQTACCGAGGGRMWFDDAPAERIGTGRVQEVLDTGAKTVAVSCPFCLVMMTDGLAARESTAQVKDVAEILLESLTRRNTS